MRNRNDVLRSIKRYVNAGFPDWEVRLDSIIATDPLAIIRSTTPITRTDSRYAVQNSMGVQVVMYPGLVGDEEAAILRAGEIEDRLFEVFNRGEARGGHSLRVPLFDYDGVGKDAAVAPDARGDHDFITLTGMSVDVVPEPEDRRLVTTICAFTAQWLRFGHSPVIEQGNVTQRVTSSNR